MALKLKKYPKRSPYWYVRGTINGFKVFESTETVKRDEAEAYLAIRSPEVYRQAKLGEAPTPTFGDAVTVYLEGGGDDRFLDPLMDAFEDTPMKDIGQTQLSDLIKKLYPDVDTRPKASTLNRNLITPFISVMRAAVGAELPGAVQRPVKRLEEEKVIATPAYDEHIQKLLPHCSVGLRALVLLMTYTGLRTGEALRITKEDISNDYISIGHTKNGEPRMVPKPEGWIFPEVGFGYDTTQGVGRALRRASKAAELPYRDGHEIGRHAFAARWLKAGHSLKDLKEAGGWKTLKVVDEVYGHLEQTRLHETMRELSRKRSTEISGAKTVQSDKVKDDK